MELKFNGKELPGFARIVGYSYNLFPELTLLESESLGRVGVHDGGVHRGKVVHTFSLMLYDQEKPMHEMRRELKAFAKGDNWKPSRIESTEFPNSYMMGRIGNSAELNDLFTHGEIDLEFHCSDPLQYAKEETVHPIIGSVSINYEGLEDVGFTVTGELEEDTNSILISNGEKELLIYASFKEGDTFEIDTDKKVVRINNKVNMRALALVSEWIYLKEGSQTIEISAKDFNPTSNIETWEDLRTATWNDLGDTTLEELLDTAVLAGEFDITYRQAD